MEAKVQNEKVTADAGARSERHRTSWQEKSDEKSGVSALLTAAASVAKGKNEAPPKKKKAPKKASSRSKKEKAAAGKKAEAMQEEDEEEEFEDETTQRWSSAQKRRLRESHLVQVCLHESTAATDSRVPETPVYSKKLPTVTIQVRVDDYLTRENAGYYYMSDDEHDLTIEQRDKTEPSSVERNLLDEVVLRSDFLGLDDDYIQEHHGKYSSAISSRQLASNTTTRAAFCSRAQSPRPLRGLG